LPGRDESSRGGVTMSSLPSSVHFGSQDRFTLLSPELLAGTQLVIDGSIHFLLMVVIIGQATVNLSQREVLSSNRT
jgi:hypothetical protein